MLRFIISFNKIFLLDFPKKSIPSSPFYKTFSSSILFMTDVKMNLIGGILLKSKKEKRIPHIFNRRFNSFLKAERQQRRKKIGEKKIFSPCNIDDLKYSVISALPANSPGICDIAKSYSDEFIAEHRAICSSLSVRLMPPCNAFQIPCVELRLLHDNPLM